MMNGHTSTSTYKASTGISIVNFEEDISASDLNQGLLNPPSSPEVEVL
jgi:hypothetical protein